MNKLTKTNLQSKTKKINPAKALAGTEMMTGWLSVRYHLPSRVRINPDYAVFNSFPCWPCLPLYMCEKYLGVNEHE